MDRENQLEDFVKYQRKKAGLSQEQLAEKAGVGLRFIRDLEQGKTSLRMDKVNQVLQLFGYSLSPGTDRLMDPWEILRHHFNRNVHIYLKNKNELYGFIIGTVGENNGVTAWKFISNNNAIAYRKTENQALVQDIPHTEIENIENSAT